MHYSLLSKLLPGRYPSFFNDLDEISSFCNQKPKISGDVVNNTIDRLSFYFPEQRVKLLHNITIYFFRQMNKSKKFTPKIKKKRLDFERYMDWVIKRNWSLVLSFNIYYNSQCAERSLLEGVYTWNVSYFLHVFAEMKFHPGMEKRKNDV